MPNAYFCCASPPSTPMLHSIASQLPHQRALVCSLPTLKGVVSQYVAHAAVVTQAARALACITSDEDTDTAVGQQNFLPILQQVLLQHSEDAHAMRATCQALANLTVSPANDFVVAGHDFLLQLKGVIEHHVDEPSVLTVAYQVC